MSVCIESDSVSHTSIQKAKITQNVTLAHTKLQKNLKIINSLLNRLLSFFFLLRHMAPLLLLLKWWKQYHNELSLYYELTV